MTKSFANGTHEWASSTVSCITGCSNDCLYCWAKTYAIRAGKKSSDTWKKETIYATDLLRNFGKRKGTVMFPATHDISLNNLDVCCNTLQKLLKSKNNVLIVSKPHIECIKEICDKFKNFKEQILFRFTIGSAYDKTLSFWEPNAPVYMERVASIIMAYKLGFETSISCEPMLDSYIYKVVEDTLPYVTNAIWIGKANHLIERLTLNGHSNDLEIMKAASSLVELQNNDQFIKEIYETYKDNTKIKWKDSIKQVVGIERPTEWGLDV